MVNSYEPYPVGLRLVRYIKKMLKNTPSTGTQTIEFGIGL